MSDHSTPSTTTSLSQLWLARCSFDASSDGKACLAAENIARPVLPSKYKIGFDELRLFHSRCQTHIQARETEHETRSISLEDMRFSSVITGLLVFVGAVHAQDVDRKASCTTFLTASPTCCPTVLPKTTTKTIACHGCALSTTSVGPACDVVGASRMELTRLIRKKEILTRALPGLFLHTHGKNRNHNRDGVQAPSY